MEKHRSQKGAKEKAALVTLEKICKSSPQRRLRILNVSVQLRKTKTSFHDWSIIQYSASTSRKTICSNDTKSPGAPVRGKTTPPIRS